MSFAKQIAHAPKNGDLIILEDANSQELGRWAQEANGWVQPDGTPVRISPTHWTRVSDDFAGPTDRERSLFLAALAAPLPDDETEQTQKRPLTRLILALVTAIFCIGGFVFWIGSEDSSSDNLAADLKREFSRARDRAFVAIGGLTATRERENVALTEALESKRIADSRQMELKQALDESGARSDALARELASARKNDVAARDLAAARERENAAQKKQTELKQALDESEKRAGASGQLTRSNRSQSDRSQPPMSSVEEAKLIAHAESLIKQFDFAGARLLLAHASEKGSARAAFMMAETYDWQVLRSLQAYGVRGDAEKAWEFYQMAARAGIEKARERAEALQQDANFGTRVGREDRSR